MASITRKKRVSKKKKIAWRKHVNIDDVENFLDDQRLEERLGKPIASKTDEELFHVDTEPAKESLTIKQKRRLRLEEAPKCFAMLQPHTNVPDPISKRNRVRTKEERRCPIVKGKEVERKLKGILKAKDRQAIQDRQLHLHNRKVLRSKPKFSEDIWDCKEIAEVIPKCEWLPAGARNHTLNGLGKYRKTVPKSLGQKRSILPSVEPPHPGMSYNPSLEDHQALLRDIAEKEKKIIKEEKHLTRVTKDIYKKFTPEKQNEMWLTEMSQGLKGANDEANDASDTEYKSINPPAKNKKKALKQRRKQKEQQKLQQAQKVAKKEKKKVADIHKLRFLKQQINKEDAKTTLLKEKREVKKGYKLKEAKRLGTTKFEEPDLEFNMASEISGNLRNISKAGSLLTDRYKSLQKRNVLQATVKQSRKRAKVKVFKRAGHKEDWKITVANSLINPKKK